MLAGHKTALADPHPVLTGGGAAQFQGLGHHAVAHGVDPLSLPRVASLAQHVEVPIAVSGMAVYAKFNYHRELLDAPWRT